MSNVLDLDDRHTWDELVVQSRCERAALGRLYDQIYEQPARIGTFRRCSQAVAVGAPGCQRSTDQEPSRRECV
jgi:hypothetical protein